MSSTARMTTAQVGLILMLTQSVACEAAEIKVIASTGVASLVSELGRQFEAETGHKVRTDFAVIAVSKRKIDAGETFDIAILGPAAIDELVAQGKIAGDTRTDFGRTGLGVAVRKDAAKPDIRTAEAFKQAMLAAISVGHSKEGLSGVHFLAAVDRLGIASEMKLKLRAYDGDGLARAISGGETQIGVTGIGPALAMPGAQFVGPLPPELQSYVVFTAGVNTSAKEPEAARSFLAFMTAPAAAPVFKAKGMERD